MHTVRTVLFYNLFLLEDMFHFMFVAYMLMSELLSKVSSHFAA